MDEPHLARLLDGGAASLGQGTRYGRRMAALALVDYYHAICKEALQIAGLGVDASSVDLTVNSTITHLPGLVNVDHLRGVPDVRYAIAHGEHHDPPQRQLEKLLEYAPRTREVLTAAATATRDRMAALGELPKQLVQLADSVEAELGTWTPEWKHRHMPLVAEMRAAAVPNAVTSMANIQLLVRGAELRANMRGYNEAYAEMHGQDGPEPEMEPEDYGEPNYDEYEPPDYDPPDYDPSDQEPPDQDSGDQEPPEENPVEADPGDYEPQDQEPRDSEPSEGQPRQRDGPD